MALRYENHQVFVQRPLYVGPLYRDVRYKLLSPVPLDEIQLARTPDGRRVLASEESGARVAIGTRFRVRSVRFPTVFERALRPVLTPRDRTWVELESVDGTPGPTFLLWLEPDSQTEPQLMADLERWISEQDPARDLERIPADDRDRVREGRIEVGMHAESIRTILGSPDSELQVPADPFSQEWRWSSPRRERWALIRQGKVVEFRVGDLDAVVARQPPALPPTETKPDAKSETPPVVAPADSAVDVPLPMPVDLDLVPTVPATGTPAPGAKP